MLYALALLLACSGDAETDTSERDTSAEAPTTAAYRVWAADTHTTCAETCAAVSGTCTNTCENGVGSARYGRSPFSSTEDVALATCDTAWASSIDDGEDTLDWEYAECCCELPIVTVLAGDVTTGGACEAVCASNDLTCTESYAWRDEGGALAGDEKMGGVRMEWTSPSGSTTSEIRNCAHNPPLQNDIAGGLKDLTAYACACEG